MEKELVMLATPAGWNDEEETEVDIVILTNGQVPQGTSNSPPPAFAVYTQWESWAGHRDMDSGDNLPTPLLLDRLHSASTARHQQINNPGQIESNSIDIHSSKTCGFLRLLQVLLNVISFETSMESIYTYKQHQVSSNLLQGTLHSFAPQKPPLIQKVAMHHMINSSKTTCSWFCINVLQLRYLSHRRGMYVHQKKSISK